jgi:serine protease Do
MSERPTGTAGENAKARKGEKAKSNGVLGNPRKGRGFRWAPLAREAAALVEELRRSVVLVQSGHGHGSGLIWDSAGLIVTNHHVVAGDRAQVELGDGRRLSAAVVGRDPHNDLAALRVTAGELRAAAIGDTTALRVGELIIAVGHPFGVRDTATLGIVSRAPSGRAATVRECTAPRELLQADVMLAPGSSGGPLVNAAGEVVGIASMVVGPGIALAVPSHVVQRFVAALAAQRPEERATEWERAA